MVISKYINRIYPLPGIFAFVLFIKNLAAIIQGHSYFIAK